MKHDAIISWQDDNQAIDAFLPLRRLTEPEAVVFRLHKLGGCVVEVWLPEAPSRYSLRRLASPHNRRLFEQFLDSLDDPPDCPKSVREVTQ